MTPEIVFLEGIGGNHVRWLLSIDPKFNLPWCNTSSVTDKVNWICENVYKDRTWHNWLTTEWQYRNQLDTTIKVDHVLNQYPQENWSDTTWQNRKQLILTIDNCTVAAYHYFMINLGLNTQTLTSLMLKFKHWNERIEDLKQLNLPSKQILPSDCISEPTLNQEWYQKIVAWAGYDDLYDHASQIHTAYYQCRQQAAKDFIKYFEGDEFKSHLDFYKNKYINQE